MKKQPTFSMKYKGHNALIGDVGLTASKSEDAQFNTGFELCLITSFPISYSLPLSAAELADRLPDFLGIDKVSHADALFRNITKLMEQIDEKAEKKRAVDAERMLRMKRTKKIKAFFERNGVDSAEALRVMFLFLDEIINQPVYHP